MGNSLSDARRQEIWQALSEAFVDTETNFNHMAECVAGVDIGLLKEIFFTEIAPVCGPNLMTPVPPVWTGFSSTYLSESIHEMHERNRNSLISKLCFLISIAFYRLYWHHYWNEIAAELEKRWQNPEYYAGEAAREDERISSILAEVEKQRQEEPRRGVVSTSLGRFLEKNCSQSVVSKMRGDGKEYKTRDSLNDEQNEEIWVALSDAFLRSKVSFGYTARCVEGVEVNLLEEIFFTEVAPVCGPNLLGLRPRIVVHFDPGYVINGIRKMQVHNRNSRIARLCHKFSVAFYRLYCRNRWKKVAGELGRLKVSSNG